MGRLVFEIAARLADRGGEQFGAVRAAVQRLHVRHRLVHVAPEVVCESVIIDKNRGAVVQADKKRRAFALAGVAGVLAMSGFLGACSTPGTQNATTPDGSIIASGELPP